MAEVIDSDADVLHTAESVESMNKSLTNTFSMRRGALTGNLKFGGTIRDKVLTTTVPIMSDASKAISVQSEEDLSNTAEICRQAQKTSQERRKLVIIMVGLPGRGKTYLCNKLVCYLDWLGHTSKHFNVGAFRRKISQPGQDQDSRFFDPRNEAGLKMRMQALNMALDALMAWLWESDDHQVAIFDATNSTLERRQFLIDKFHNKVQYMFIESICNDEETLRKNVELKLKYSPDYANSDPDEAMQDFNNRIKEYEKVYVPLTDGKSNRHVHFIQLVNMVTGKGHIDVNRISGYIPGKIVFFLMQICRSGLTSNRRIWLTRHGESEFNRKGLIGGDAGLTEKGDKYSHALARALFRLVVLPEDEDELLAVSCWTSTLRRTIQTAKHVPFPKLRWKALDEIHAGICDGHTYEQIKEKWPETYAARKADKLNFRYPAGESYMDVVQRLESVIIEVERESESVCIVGHQAILRVLYSYFMQVPRDEMPELQMPLHTLIELEPRPDGTMVERRYKIDIETTDDEKLFESVSIVASPGSPGSKPLHTFDPMKPPSNSFESSRTEADYRVAIETAEEQAAVRSQPAMHNHREHEQSSLRTVKFNEDTIASEASCGPTALSQSLRQVSIASCASEWVDTALKQSPSR